MPKKSASRDDDIEVVLGGGLIKGFAHIGFLQALEKLRVRKGTLTGVSIGAWISAFVSNGYPLDEVFDIFVEEILSITPARIVMALLMPGWLLGNEAGMINIKAIADDMVKRYKLKPKANLRIVAMNLLSRKPVVFEGCHYDLGTAIGASSAVPLIMRPVWFGQKGTISTCLTLLGSVLNVTNSGVLVDGGIFHPAPGDFAKHRAIIAKLGFASQLPPRLMGPVDMWFHMLELVSSPLLNWCFPDPKQHIVVPVAAPDVACFSLGLSRTELQRMVQYGERVTIEHLLPAIEDGFVPVARKSGAQQRRDFSKTAVRRQPVSGGASLHAPLRVRRAL